MSCHTTQNARNASCTYATLQSTSNWNSDTCAYVLTPLTTRGTQALFVVNFVKLHLSAFDNYIAKIEVGCLRRPEASTIGSQPLNEDYSHGWQILDTQPWAPTPCKGPPSKATASSERMGLSHGGGKARAPRNNAQVRRHPATELNLLR